MRTIDTLAWYAGLGGLMCLVIWTSVGGRTPTLGTGILYVLALVGWNTVLRHPPRMVDPDRQATHADYFGCVAAAMWFVLPKVLEVLEPLTDGARATIVVVFALIGTVIPVVCALRRREFDAIAAPRFLW